MLTKSFASPTAVKNNGGIPLAVGCVLLALFSGCATFRSGGAPAPSASYGQDLTSLQTIEGDDAKLETFSKNRTKDQRNAYISANLNLINLRYSQFLQDSSAQRQAINTIVDFIELSLGVAGTGFTSASTKTMLAASAATVSGTKTTIDKNYFYQKTEAALISAMNAARKQALVPILTGMKQDLDQYGIGNAVTDLHQYYFAGTFLGALEGVQQTSAKAESDAKAEIRSVQAATAQQTIDKTALTAAIGKIDASKAADAVLALTALRDMRSTFKDAAIPLPTDIAGIKDQLQDVVRHCSVEQLPAVHSEFTKQKLL